MSSSSHCYVDRKRHSIRDPAELQYIEETIAAIRLRTQHHDPYEEWEKQTRKEAFVRHYTFLTEQRLMIQPFSEQHGKN